MKSYSKPLLTKSNQRYENVQLDSGDCAGGYKNYCEANRDLGGACHKFTPDTTDDCKYLKIGILGIPYCSYNWN